MIHYTFYQKNPASHYVYIDMLIDNITSSKLQLQLASWRPGRYELGNFAKNIKRVDVYNEKGENLVYTKLNKDLWEIDTQNSTTIKITYSYYAAELNAGACYADENQLYINPVHTCMYALGRENEEHQIELKNLENYKIACSLKQLNNKLIASNYEELVDSPFIASLTIQSDFYEINGIKFWIHFQGECKPDWTVFKNNFSAFTQNQIIFWGDFPYNEYHFLIQVLPHKFYHGVEHKKNTVIAIGPGYNLNQWETYESVLGVCCHELFHVWNIKTIRPIEMQPYNYTKENYSRTGYVYEGFTTYYGDKILLSSDVFDNQKYFITLQERLLKHFHNYGRYNLSVTESSWETWLDGYVPGAPYRKTNIYDEGSLIAFMLDTRILQATQNKKSLRDVCRLLYQEFGKKEIGYTEKNILQLVNKVSGIDFSDFFTKYIYTASDFEIPLEESFNYIGLEFHKENSQQVNEHLFGFKILIEHHMTKVALVAPYSPAWKAGLFNGDEIMAVNNHIVKHNLNNWLHYFNTESEITLTINKAEQIKTLVLSKDKKNQTYFFNPILKLSETGNTEQKNNFNIWKIS